MKAYQKYQVGLDCVLYRGIINFGRTIARGSLGPSHLSVDYSVWPRMDACTRRTHHHVCCHYFFLSRPMAPHTVPFFHSRPRRQSATDTIKGGLIAGDA